MSEETSYWRAVWFVPQDGADEYRRQMEHLQGDEFLGSNKWPTEIACLDRAENDRRLFDSLEAPIRFLRAQKFMKEQAQ